MSVNWGVARLDLDVAAIAKAKEELGPMAMCTPEGRSRAQAIKQELKQEDEMEMLRRTR